MTIAVPPFVIAVLLTFGWFAVVNAVMSAIVAIVSAFCDDGIAADPRRARRLALIRLAPAAVAAIAAAGLFLPAHIKLEPPLAEERLGLWLFAAGISGIALVLMSSIRLFRVWRSSARLSPARVRTVRSGRVPLVEVPLLPGIALAGIVRPRILIGSRIARVLSAAEMQVAVAHELAHQRAGDNLTRLLMRCAPDFLAGTAAARRLETLWAGEAECLADAAAAGGSAARANRLASALVKIGRLAAGERAWSPEWSTLHHPPLLELRVRRLVSGARVPPGSARWTAAAAAIGTAAAITAWLIGLPVELHWLTESLLHR
jgi:Zn-dependent protease with chaperone function